MDRQQKKLLMIFLLFYIIILVLLLASAIIYYYVSYMPGPDADIAEIQRMKNSAFLYPLIFGILAPILFYVIWKWKYKAK